MIIAMRSVYLKTGRRWPCDRRSPAGSPRLCACSHGSHEAPRPQVGPHNVLRSAPRVKRQVRCFTSPSLTIACLQRSPRNYLLGCAHSSLRRSRYGACSSISVALLSSSSGKARSAARACASATSSAKRRACVAFSRSRSISPMAHRPETGGVCATSFPGAGLSLSRWCLTLGLTSDGDTLGHLHSAVQRSFCGMTNTRPSVSLSVQAISDHR